MAELTSHQSGATAVLHLLATGLVQTIKQAVDAILGIWLIFASLAFVSDSLGLGIEGILSVSDVPLLVYYGSLSLFVWILLLIGVVVPERLIEFSDTDELLEDREGVNREAMRGAVEIMNVLYRGTVVLLAAVPAVVVSGTPFGWFAPVFIFGVPVIEMAAQARGGWSPAFMAAFLLFAMLLPVIFVTATIIYSLHRTPHAVGRAADTLGPFIRAASESRAETHTLIDLLAERVRPHR